MGIEPTTYSLRVNCSTPEPLWQLLMNAMYFNRCFVSLSTGRLILQSRCLKISVYKIKQVGYKLEREILNK